MAVVVYELVSRGAHRGGGKINYRHRFERQPGAVKSIVSEEFLSTNLADSDNSTDTAGRWAVTIGKLRFSGVNKYSVSVRINSRDVYPYLEQNLRCLTEQQDELSFDECLTAIRGKLGNDAQRDHFIIDKLMEISTKLTALDQRVVAMEEKLTNELNFMQNVLQDIYHRPVCQASRNSHGCCGY